MKLFEERNPFVIGAIGSGLVVAIVLASLNYPKLPLFNDTKEYTAYFADAGGLLSGAAVQVSGLQAGQVQSISLDHSRVLVQFTVNKSVYMGDRTEVAIKTRSLLGAKVLEVTPRGEGTLSGAIPLDRTRSPYQLPDALGDLSATISGLNTTQVSDSLAVLADTFKDSPPALRVAVDGVTQFSRTLNERDAELRSLLENANETTSVLADRSQAVVKLIGDLDSLLTQLQTQASALDQISGNITSVANQVKGVIADNRATLKPALDKLNGVLTIVDNRKGEIQEVIKRLNTYAITLGESLSAGPFFKAYLANLLPGQFVQPFVEAAFSDLGLDPHVLLPSERHDPETGQPGTPALPVPYPRTGQGGEPRMTVPDAITGNPGDQPCGPPGAPLPGPGCYPYRQPLPAPPPGGPPPGPPAAPGAEASPVTQETTPHASVEGEGP